MIIPCNKMPLSGVIVYSMRWRLAIFLSLFVATLGCRAQERQAENKPYIDLRPMHFGVVVGMHMQDIEFQNVGPQVITLADGSTGEQTILCDADNWNPGISVGVVADVRLGDHFNLRFTPTMHFGAKHLVFKNLSDLDADGNPSQTTQDLKNTYISLPLDLKFSGKRYENRRPYLMAGINPMINLTGKDQDIVQLKRFDTYVEVGLGVDLYLRFFKLIPELKFCYSLSNSLNKKHADELSDANLKAYATSVSSGHSKMIVLSFSFE